ncbi:zinc ribbon domain-containing protein [Salinibius halmophilus]|uniref:zinc ribbon domain-containing protein n=1 Tax=Salinibius halmophilus TaxID=1853216 RepID=UPI000E664EE1|nr:zinc ribbon domain-containing protein [Salinibius halmophilus]
MNQCPDCKTELEYQDGNYACASCQTLFSKHAFCDTCDSELERLAACGAVSYFCKPCNQLKSKSTARYEFRPV